MAKLGFEWFSAIDTGMLVARLRELALVPFLRYGGSGQVHEVTMDAFRLYVRDLAKNGAKKRVRTTSVEQASAIFEGMFASARGKVCIYSEQLLPDVFGSFEVLDAAGGFLARTGAVLQVLIQRPEKMVRWDEHPLLRSLTAGPSEGRGRVMVRAATGPYAEVGAHHFAVTEKAYRFEIDHRTCEAITNFNEPETAERLQQAFDAAFSMTRRTLFDSSHGHGHRREGTEAGSLVA